MNISYFLKWGGFFGRGEGEGGGVDGWEGRGLGGGLRGEGVLY